MPDRPDGRWRYLIDSGFVIFIVGIIWQGARFYDEHEQMKADIATCKQALLDIQQFETKTELRIQAVEIRAGLRESEDAH